MPLLVDWMNSPLRFRFVRLVKNLELQLKIRLGLVLNHRDNDTKAKLLGLDGTVAHVANSAFVNR